MIRLDTSTAELLVRAEVPGRPPSVNGIWRRTGRSVYKTPGATQWQSAATAILNREKKQYKIKRPYDGTVYVEVVIYTKGKLTAFDADNHIKGAQDCLAYAGIIVDDKQAIGSSGYKQKTKGPTRTVIEVWKVPEDLDTGGNP